MFFFLPVCKSSTRSYSCSSNRRCRIHWLACCTSIIKGLIPCNNCGMTLFNIVFVPFSYLWCYTLLIIQSRQDNLSRGNLGAVKVLQELFPEYGRLQFIYADLGDAKSVSFLLDMLWFIFLKNTRNTICLEYKCCLNWYVQVNKIFSENAFDAVMHFAAVAYVGESTLDPLK